jgi:hypothetical protein
LGWDEFSYHFRMTLLRYREQSLTGPLRFPSILQVSVLPVELPYFEGVLPESILKRVLPYLLPSMEGSIFLRAYITSNRAAYDQEKEV